MTGSRLRSARDAGWHAPRPGRCRVAALRPTSLRPPSFFLPPHLRRKKFRRTFIQADPSGPFQSPGTPSPDGRAPAPSLQAAANPGDPRPAPHLLLALAAEAQARGPLLVAVAVIGTGLIRLELHHPQGPGGGAVRVAGGEGGEPAPDGRARARVPDSAKGNREGEPLIRYELCRWSATASFSPSQAPRCRRRHGCRPRCRHGRRRLYRRHPRRRPRRHLGHATSAA